MYGRNGLITFMHHLFALFDEQAMKENVNYYFAIKQQIGDMESFEESLHQMRKERIKNKPINEADEYNDEETKQSPIM
jgi:hypothetical protein